MSCRPYVPPRKEAMPLTARRCQGRATGPSLHVPRAEGVASSLPGSWVGEAVSPRLVAAAVSVRAGGSEEGGAVRRLRPGLRSFPMRMAGRGGPTRRGQGPLHCHPKSPRGLTPGQARSHSVGHHVLPGQVDVEAHHVPLSVQAGGSGREPRRSADSAKASQRFPTGEDQPGALPAAARGPSRDVRRSTDPPQRPRPGHPTVSSRFRAGQRTVQLPATTRPKGPHDHPGCLARQLSASRTRKMPWQKSSERQEKW